jgi:GDP-mannose 6-dehydrogenase
MRIAVLGLGYVGCVTAAALAARGHTVVGVDLDPTKVELVTAGRSPIVEAGVDELVRETVAAGRLTATTQTSPAVRAAEVSLVCVGTPSTRGGELDLSAVRRVSHDIGQALADRTSDHVVAVRSTMLPGSVAEVVVPAIEAGAGRRVGGLAGGSPAEATGGSPAEATGGSPAEATGGGIGVCVNPEFLREGSALADYHDPPFTLIGSDDPATAMVVAQLYDDLDAPLVLTDLGPAELVKYASNAFHALKVTFANELGLLAKELGVDSHAVMDVFVRDTRLNISPAYLKPGFAFGGSCLPKDVRSLVARARTSHLDLPVLAAILPSNERHLESAVTLVEQAGRRRVGILGLSFKPGTDDLRESPNVALTERLIGKGYDVRIFDANVSLARIVGANRRYIEETIPHLSSLLVTDLAEVVDHAEVLVVGVADPAFVALPELVRADQHVIDLVRLDLDPAALAGSYEGVAW